MVIHPARQYLVACLITITKPGLAANRVHQRDKPTDVIQPSVVWDDTNHQEQPASTPAQMDSGLTPGSS